MKKRIAKSKQSLDKKIELFSSPCGMDAFPDYFFPTEATKTHQVAGKKTKEMASAMEEKINIRAKP